MPDKVECSLATIDHVFQKGLFHRSKIFHLENSVFLMSLYEEIIVIKRHFNKFVIWDNVSITASKSAERRGQLVLADKIVWVYTELG